MAKIMKQDVWAPGHFGAGACASEILGSIGQSSNVTAISGKHYFHQSNFRHHHFHLEKIYLLRLV